jgi:hypothetical protein
MTGGVRFPAQVRIGFATQIAERGPPLHGNNANITPSTSILPPPATRSARNVSCIRFPEVVVI